MTTEFKIELTKGLNRTKDYLSKLTFQQNMYKDCILSHNYVISVGGFTINTRKEGGKTILDYRFNEMPALWTKEGAEDNKRALQVNDNREITIKGKHTWYADEIKKVNLMIESLNTVLSR